jgi:transitional endoplasmic reticulum ATPase
VKRDEPRRTGRIERKIEVGEPDRETRREFLATSSRNRPRADDVGHRTTLKPH